MTHTRTRIRRLVQGALIGKTDAEDRVFTTRVIPVRRQKLPVISVYTFTDTVDSDAINSAPRELKHALPVVVEAWVAPGENVDDAMDVMASQIEEAMHLDPFFGVDDCSSIDSILASTDLAVVVDSDRQMGLVVLTYDFTYFTPAPAPPEDLDKFDTMEATHEVGDENTQDAVDLVKDLYDPT